VHLLFLHDDYRQFLDWLYTQQPDLDEEPYREQYARRMATHFGGTIRYLPGAVKALGHETTLLFPNNEPLQRAWAAEHGVTPGGLERLQDGLTGVENLARGALRRLPDAVVAGRNPLNREPRWYRRILAAQMDYYDPDVVVNMGLSVRTAFLKRVTTDATLVGTIGIPEHHDERLEPYDLAVSHVPGGEEVLSSLDTPSMLLRHCFGRSIRADIERPVSTDIPVSFVGSLTPKHRRRVRVLEALADSVPLQVWAPSVEGLPADSALRDAHRGQAWGTDMYRVLAKSAVTVNVHIDSASTPANLRLYEATGLGTPLVTEAMDGLEAVFDPGREVGTYEDPKECVEVVRSLLADDDRRASMAKAARSRTMAEHTCQHRAQTLLEAIETCC
jgi:hypothetical protein